MVWPLRRRVTSTKVYIYSIVLVWISGISVGALLLLAAYGILDNETLEHFSAHRRSFSFVDNLLFVSGNMKTT